MKNVTIWELAFELFRSKVLPEDIAKRLGVGRATVYRWLGGIRFRGIRIPSQHRVWISELRMRLRMEIGEGVW